MGVPHQSKLELSGTRNLRDPGGLPVAGGGAVRPGVLLRAEVLALPEDSALEAVWDVRHATEFAALGIQTVIDLRSEKEATRVPSQWGTATGAEVLSLQIADGAAGAGTSIMRQLLTGELRSFGPEDLARFYRHILDRYAEVFAGVVAVLAQPQRLPVLVHCMAGKDRTGLLTALVLSTIGVPHEAVLADYALSGVLRPDRMDPYVERLVAAGTLPDDVRAIFESPVSAMEAALTHLDTEYDGPKGYLLRAGVEPAQLATLSENLVDLPSRG